MSVAHFPGANVPCARFGENLEIVVFKTFDQQSAAPEAGGVELVGENGDGPGVRLRKSPRENPRVGGSVLDDRRARKVWVCKPLLSLVER
jgi:hypothetical protein